MTDAVGPVRTVGFVGLGVMGSAMSRRVAAAGYEVHGFDIVPGRVESLRSAGGQGAASVAALASICDVILLSLPTERSLELTTNELVGGVRAGTVVAEMGTFSVESKHLARRRLAGVGAELMDVPVSGTGLQAEDGTLVVMASGSPQAFERARGVFDAVGRVTHYVGDFPNGSLMKYVANLLVAVNNLAAAEAHLLGLAAGLDPLVMHQVISDGVGSSRMFEIRGLMMAHDDYGDEPSARLDLLLKDLGIIQRFTESVGVHAPLLELSKQMYEDAGSSGFGSRDPAEICRFLEERQGIKRHRV